MNIKKMSDEAVREILESLIEQMDELDQDDFFGSEGWEHYFGFEF